MSQPFIGEIRLGGWNFAPVDWAFCDGSIQSISQNETLFNLIGTTYGGNGQTTYALPNLLGRVPIHMGTDNSDHTYILAQSSGTETVTLQTNELPVHSHDLQADSAAASSTSPSGTTPAVSAVDVYITPTDATATAAATTTAGGQQPHDNLMPYQCITYIIALYGVYPSQD